MHLIFLSGGSGKRLWPLSSDTVSKQFIKLLVDKEGNRESMIQRLYNQAKGLNCWQSITFVSGSSQIEQIRSQIGDVRIAIEPERRDTFPAIALATAYIAEELNMDKGDIVGVVPADALVEEDFFKRVYELEKLLDESGFQVGLLGAVPTSASEKFGYIIPGENDNMVSNFLEKPEKEAAVQAIKKGALWNCGVFAFKGEFIAEHLKESYGIEDFKYKELISSFPRLNKRSFDYEMLEKSKNIAYLPYNGKWKDLGTWESLCEELDEEIKGNALLDKDCSNLHVINERKEPLVVMGIKDSVVVCNNQGVLVANKSNTDKLKLLVDGISQRQMFEERRWGSYEVLNLSRGTEAQIALTKKLNIKRDCQISYQYHDNRKEIWTIIKGRGIFYYEGNKREIVEGETVIIDIKEKNGIKAITPLEIIEVQIGKILSEDDIERLEFDW